MESNTVERATETETDTRADSKEVGRLGWFTSKTYTATTPPREGEPVRSPTKQRKTKYEWVKCASRWLQPFRVPNDQVYDCSSPSFFYIRGLVMVRLAGRQSGAYPVFS